MPYMRRLLLDLPARPCEVYLEFDHLIRKALCGGGWPCLTFLGLREEDRKPLSDAACRPIADALACTPSLRCQLKLVLTRGASSKFSAASGIALWSALRQLLQLQTLYLGACEIGAEGTEALGEALAVMPSLESLEVSLANLNLKTQHSFKTRIPRKVGGGGGGRQHPLSLGTGPQGLRRGSRGADGCTRAVPPRRWARTRRRNRTPHTITAAASPG